jgi:uncharacterized protein
MRVSGSYTLDAPRSVVWPRIFDPSSLISLIPGCQRLEQVSPGEYRGQLLVWLSAVNGAYETYVKVEDQAEPDHCRFRGEVTGPTGVISGTAAFTLEALPDQRTLLDYQADGLVTGALGKLNARFLEGVAHTLIQQGLVKLNEELLLEQAAAAPVVITANAGPSTTTSVIPSARRSGCALSILRFPLAKTRSARPR